MFSVDSQEIIPSGGFVTKNGNTVSANWGGFQAAASLADDGSVGSASASVNGVGVGSAYAPVDALPGTGGIENGAGNAGVFYGGKPGSDKPGSGKPGSGNHHHQQYQLDGSGINGGGFFDRIFAVSASNRGEPNDRVFRSFFSKIPFRPLCSATEPETRGRMT